MQLPPRRVFEEVRDARRALIDLASGSRVVPAQHAEAPPTQRSVGLPRSAVKQMLRLDEPGPGLLVATAQTAE